LQIASLAEFFQDHFAALPAVLFTAICRVHVTAKAWSSFAHASHA
jgi:hypothetical protein